MRPGRLFLRSPLPLLALAGLLAAAVCLCRPAGRNAYLDPLDAPAPLLASPGRLPLLAVARAGGRLVAAGLNGQVLTSDDHGRHWTPARVPVSTELVSVRFPTPASGWITAHGGVVLHSDDAGGSWSRRLDGRMAARLLAAHFQALVDGGHKTAQPFLEQVQLDFANGPEQPFLDAWFDDERSGYVCGPFGLLLVTHDGGASWQSAMEQLDNPEFRHLFAVQRIAGVLYIASEKGTVFRFDADRGRFTALDTGFKGSLFGLVGGADSLIAYGLKGAAYRSRDAGRSWQRLDTGVGTSITAATRTDDGRLLLVSQGGDVRISADDGTSFHSVDGVRASTFAGVAAAGRDIVLVGPGGIQTTALRD